MSYKRRYDRLCRCGTTILGGTWCPTCHENTSLADRARGSWKQRRAQRAWKREGTP